MSEIINTARSYKKTYDLRQEYFHECIKCKRLDDIQGYDMYREKFYQSGSDLSAIEGLLAELIFGMEYNYVQVDDVIYRAVSATKLIVITPDQITRLI